MQPEEYHGIRETVEEETKEKTENEPERGLSKRIGHLGFVAGMCDEIGLSRLVDQMISPDQRAESSVGECLKLVIVNAMGFTAHPLYLEAKDFSQRPLKHLPGRNVSAKTITDDRLGRALDRLYEVGCDRLFSTGAVPYFNNSMLTRLFDM